MDAQLIIVYFILAWATAFTVKRLFDFFRKPASGCQSCPSAAAGCSLREIKQKQIASGILK